MLLSWQIADVARKLRDEAAARPYVRTLVPHVVDDEQFWAVTLELLELVIHAEGYVMVERDRVKDAPESASSTSSA